MFEEIKELHRKIVLSLEDVERNFVMDNNNNSIRSKFKRAEKKLDRTIMLNCKYNIQKTIFSELIFRNKIRILQHSKIYSFELYFSTRLSKDSNEFYHMYNYCIDHLTFPQRKCVTK